MPPPPIPPTPDPDELASAIVDGLLSPADAEAALRDPAVSRRVEQLEQLRSAMRAAPPAPAHLADRMIANAISATQAEHAPAVVAFRPPAPAPARRARLAPWLAAAAAILVVGLVAIGLVAQRSGDDAEDQATSAESLDDSGASVDKSEGGAGGDATTTQPEADASAPSASPEAEENASAVMADLGSFSSADELATDVESRVAEGQGRLGADAADEPPPTSERESCSGLTAAGDPDRGSVIFAGTATYKSNPVVVHVYESDGEQRLVATDHSCSDVVDRPFTGG